MAQRIKIQDGILVCEHADNTQFLNFQVNGDIFNRAFYSTFGDVSDTLTVGEDGSTTGGITILGETSTSTGFLSTDDDQSFQIETGNNGDITLKSGSGGHIYIHGPVSENLIFGSSATVTGLPTPVNASDAASKSYVDALVQGLSFKQPVRVATTTNITLSGTQTIDGVAVISGDRVLVKSQTTTSQNGIYIVAAGVWTRSTDADTGAELVGAYVFVDEGTIYIDTSWAQITPATIIIGTSAIVWNQFSGAGTYSAGVGLSLTGTQFFISNTGVTAGSYTSVIVNSRGQVTTGSQIVSSDVTTALGYTPYNSTNPSNYLTATTGVRKIVAGANISISPVSGFGDVTITVVGPVSASTATSIVNGAAGQVLYQSAPSTTSFVTAGTSGQVFISGGTGSPAWTSNPTVTGSITAAFIIGSVSNSVSATGLTQGTAAPMVSQINVVTSSVTANSLGIILPIAVIGMRILVINASLNTINIYPVAGSQIDNLGVNIARQLGVTSKMEFIATSSTQWYAMGAMWDS